MTFDYSVDGTKDTVQQSFHIHPVISNQNSRDGTDGVIDIFRGDDITTGLFVDAKKFRYMNPQEGDQVWISGPTDTPEVYLTLSKALSNDDLAWEVAAIPTDNFTLTYLAMYVGRDVNTLPKFKDLITKVLPFNVVMVLDETGTDADQKAVIGEDGVRNLFELPVDILGPQNARRIHNFNTDDRDGLHISDVDRVIAQTSVNSDGMTETRIYRGSVVDDQLTAVLVDFDMGDEGNTLTSDMIYSYVYVNADENRIANTTLLVIRTVDNGVITDTHDGGSIAGRNEMSGTANQNDVFVVDTTASDRDGADTITGFEDGRDSVKIAANDGDVGGTVGWKAVADATDPTKNDITIYAGNAEDANRILAVIEDFDGTFDGNDFEALPSLSIVEIQ